MQDLGAQDIVVANRFLCHMHPDDAEACLCHLSRLVKNNGYLFVSGVDLAVRSKVARELGWRPVTDLIRGIHDGDPTLRRDWPLDYWGLEPFDRGQSDWKVRYASVFQLPESAAAGGESPAAATSMSRPPDRCRAMRGMTRSKTRSRWRIVAGVRECKSESNARGDRRQVARAGRPVGVGLAGEGRLRHGRPRT